MAEERLDNIRENQDVSIEILDPVTFEQQTYSAQDNNLISKTEFTTAFTSSVPIATLPPKVEIPLIERADPTMLSANTDPPVN